MEKQGHKFKRMMMCLQHIVLFSLFCVVSMQGQYAFATCSEYVECNTACQEDEHCQGILVLLEEEAQQRDSEDVPYFSIIGEYEKWVNTILPYYATGVYAQYWRTTHGADTRWYLVPEQPHMKKGYQAGEAESRWNVREQKYYISMIPEDAYYGEPYKHHELNYIAQGWISAYRGEPLATLFLVIRGWKLLKYHKLPTSKTLSMAQMGWEMYHERGRVNIRNAIISMNEYTKMRQKMNVIRDDQPR